MGLMNAPIGQSLNIVASVRLKSSDGATHGATL
jgi:hypothetical protein